MIPWPPVPPAGGGGVRRAFPGDDAGAPHVERASDFGVTDLVAPVMGSDGVIATLITPFIEQAPLNCTKDEAAALLVRAGEAISDQMGAVSQAWIEMSPIFC